MTWMLTASGTKFGLRFIGHDSIHIEDIAHHLAQINRWTGACRRPMSVAEHSILVVEIMRRELGVTHPGALLAGLMHDAHEAYTNDMTSPMKSVIGAAWSIEESRIAAGVTRRFGLTPWAWTYGEHIKAADKRAANSERAQLLPASTHPAPMDQVDPPQEWTDHPPVTWYRAQTFDHFTWDSWRLAFLARFHELGRELQALGQLPVQWSNVDGFASVQGVGA